MSRASFGRSARRGRRGRACCAGRLGRQGRLGHLGRLDPRRLGGVDDFLVAIHVDRRLLNDLVIKVAHQVLFKQFREGLVNNHAYAVLNVDVDALTITLKNPWGRGVLKKGDKENSQNGPPKECLP